MHQVSRLTGVALACVLAACGGEVDDRPREFSYIVRTIFQPNCASAQCHSTFSQQGRQGNDTLVPIVLDSVEGTRQSFANDEALLDHFNDELVPTLLTNLTTETTSEPRMPYDNPLPAEDVALIADWISLGGPGVCPSGVDHVCHGTHEYECDLGTRAYIKPNGKTCTVHP